MAEKFVDNIRFDTYDVDMNGTAKASSYVRKMQEIGIRQMAKDGPSDEELRTLGRAFMITRLDLKINKELKQNQITQASSWACESKLATFLRGYEILSPEDDGIPAVSAVSQWALVDLESRKILRVKDINLSQYYIGPYHEIFEKKFKISDDIEGQLKLIDSRRVYLRDIDRNGHMNNTYTIDMFLDYITELISGTGRVEKLRLHFVNEAKLGDELKIFSTNQNNVYWFKSILPNGEINVQAEIYIK